MAERISNLDFLTITPDRVNQRVTLTTDGGRNFHLPLDAVDELVAGLMEAAGQVSDQSLFVIGEYVWLVEDVVLFVEDIKWEGDTSYAVLSVTVPTSNISRTLP